MINTIHSCKNIDIPINFERLYTTLKYIYICYGPQLNTEHAFDCTQLQKFS